MFLSGGLDSSIIAQCLKRKLGSLNTFTTVVDPNIINKEDYIRMLKWQKNLLMK